MHATYIYSIIKLFDFFEGEEEETFLHEWYFIDTRTYERETIILSQLQTLLPPSLLYFGRSHYMIELVS